MKTGTTISGIAHAGLLGWGLIFLDVAPPDFNIELDQAQIDIAKEDNFELATGDEKADISPKPAPQIVKPPVENPDARNFGDTKTDNKTKADKVEKTEVVDVSSSSKSKVADPVRAIEPDISEQDVREETPVPTNQVASINEPAAPVTDSQDDTQTSVSDDGNQFAKLPDIAPVPLVRPARPKLAKTRDRQNVDRIKKKVKKSNSTDEDTSTDDQIANLLNKQKATKSGARTSTSPASLGNNNNNTSNTLSRGEMDGLIDAISDCSSGITGRLISEDLAVTVTMDLAKDGSIIGNPSAQARGGTQGERRSFTREVLRYVKRCAPYDFLPKDKYDSWARVIPTFHPAEMFR